MALVISSPLSQKTFAARLKRSIADSFRLAHGSTPYTSTKLVAGEVYKWTNGSVRFFIFKRRRVINSLAPRLEGWISATDNGSEIKAMLDLRHLLVEIILFQGIIVWFIFSIGESMLGTLSQGWLNILIGIGVIAVLGQVIRGWYDMQYLKRFLVRFVNNLSQASEEKLEIALRGSNKT